MPGSATDRIGIHPPHHVEHKARYKTRPRNLRQGKRALDVVDVRQGVGGLSCIHYLFDEQPDKLLGFGFGRNTVGDGVEIRIQHAGAHDRDAVGRPVGRNEVVGDFDRVGDAVVGRVAREGMDAEKPRGRSAACAPSNGASDRINNIVFIMRFLGSIQMDHNGCFQRVAERAAMMSKSPGSSTHFFAAHRNSGKPAPQSPNQTRSYSSV